MSAFLAVSAVRLREVDAVTDAVTQFLARHQVESELFDSADGHEASDRDAAVFAPIADWSVILWPQYFNVHDFAACQAISADLDTVICSAHVYQDEYWSHGLFESGEWVDRFCSAPDSDAESEQDARRLAAEYRGDPACYAARFGVAESRIAGYFVQFLADAESEPSGKVDPSDEFELEDWWVFTDFWKCLGIPYPDDAAGWDKCIRIARRFDERLPSLGDL